MRRLAEASGSQESVRRKAPGFAREQADTPQVDPPSTPLQLEPPSPGQERENGEERGKSLKPKVGREVGEMNLISSKIQGLESLSAHSSSGAKG